MSERGGAQDVRKTCLTRVDKSGHSATRAEWLAPERQRSDPIVDALRGDAWREWRGIHDHDLLTYNRIQRHDFGNVGSPRAISLQRVAVRLTVRKTFVGPYHHRS